MSDDYDDDEYGVPTSIVPRTHGRWTVINGLLSMATDIFTAFADFFAQMTAASAQHTAKKFQMNDLHEQVGLDLETLPVKEKDSD